ncbi:MAG: IS4 family transposase [Flavisolibacter sp.]
MLQNNSFSGQPVFSQITGLINKSSFKQLVNQYDADRYCKKCGSWEHFVCMLYCIMNNCTSLREVTQGIAAYGDKLNHLGINYTPPRSTFSEANARRSEEFFGAVYQKLYGHYKSGLSDSQNQNELLKRLFIIDSTTISLFKAILKCVGRKSIDGKSKGGIKVHTMLNAYEQIPQLIHFSDAATHDHTFLSKIKLQPHQIALFDKAYVDYRQYAKWIDKNIFFVTRLKDNAVYEQLNEIPIPDSIPPDYIKDQKVAIKYKGEHNTHCQLELRRVVYYDNEKDRVFEFLTNIMDMSAEQIGLLYKMRWQIEMLFKQLKQNFPLKYFLGDNENAIKIQIWCTLIANLLFTIVKKNINKKISFSNLVSFTRQHLFSYNKITDLIEKVERYWRKKYAGKPQIIPNLFDG